MFWYMFCISYFVLVGLTWGVISLIRFELNYAREKNIWRERMYDRGLLLRKKK